MEGGTAFEVVLGGCLVVGPIVEMEMLVCVLSRVRREWIWCQDLHLLSTVNETLLNRGDTLLLLDALLDASNLEYSNPCVTSWLLQIGHGRWG